MPTEFYLRVIAVLALAGVIVSAVSLQRHYAKSATAYCDFSQKFSCDIVNRSEYSTLHGNSGRGDWGCRVRSAVSPIHILESRTRKRRTACWGRLLQD